MIIFNASLHLTTTISRILFYGNKSLYSNGFGGWDNVIPPLPGHLKIYQEETQGRRHQKYKTGVSMSPKKELMSSIFLKRRIRRSTINVQISSFLRHPPPPKQPADLCAAHTQAHPRTHTHTHTHTQKSDSLIVTD